MWASVAALRSNIDAAEYKHIVLGLLFLKCIFNAFEERFVELQDEIEDGRILLQAENLYGGWQAA